MSDIKVMGVADFPPLVEPGSRWGSPVEREVRRRITVCVAAYGYEVVNKPIMSDTQWDQLAQEIDPRVGTCHPILDEFFVTQFSPMTGMWIHDHPDLPGIKRTFDRYYAATRDLHEGVRR